MSSKDTRKVKSSKSKDNSKKSKNLRIEALKVSIEKKKECNSKALEIVAKCSEETIDEESLLIDLKFINQEYYQDIVEERAISKMCGYPVCPGHLKNIPAKQFHISTTQNKVFDITDRKNFCSNLCYKASKYLKDQILTSPVWLRELDFKESYKLISLQSKGGVVGDEVDFGITSLTAETLEEKISDDENSKPKDDLETKKEVSFASSRTTQDVDNSCEEDEEYFDCFDNIPVEEKQNRESDTIDSHCRLDSEETTPHIEVPCENCAESIKISTDDIAVDEKSENNSNAACNDCDPKNGPTLKISNNHADLVEKSGASLDPKSSESTKEKKIVTKKKLSKRKSLDKHVSAKDNPVQNLVLKVENVLKEWFTLESVCFIFGENKVKEMIEERYNHITQWRQSTNATQDIHFYERYLSLCRKLNVLELKDNQIDASFKEQIRKPLPDVEKLKEETTEMQLKVNRFFKGDTVMFEEVARSSVKDGEEAQEPVLPLVDLHAQKALRKRIVLDKLRKTIEDLRLSLGLRGVDLSEPTRTLISTFTLSAHNITFKPAEWNLLSIIVIKLLSCRDHMLEQCLKSSASSKHLTLLLMSYSLDSAYLDRLVTWLTSLDSLIQNTQTS